MTIILSSQTKTFHTKIMKHTKIRSSCFETNSSSTHAYTVYTGGNLKANFKPIITEAPIVVPSGLSSCDTWQSKLASLVGYLVLQKREDEIDNIQDIFFRFSGKEPTFDLTRIKESINHPKWPLDLEGFFEEFSPRGPYGDEYGNTPEELEKFLNRILLTEESILGFVCANGWIEENEYYDG